MIFMTMITAMKMTHVDDDGGDKDDYGNYAHYDDGDANDDDEKMTKEPMFMMINRKIMMVTKMTMTTMKTMLVAV